MDSVEQNTPLVSIIVITYNSSKYVLETLESAKEQTYQNIELIISDDSSQDDTVEICKNWLLQNRDRFVRTDLITVDKNTGVSANCNRGVKVSKGEWIKMIAGDDLLCDKCIESNVTFANSNIDCLVNFSTVLQFVNKDGVKTFIDKFPTKEQKFFFNQNSKLQYLQLLEHNFVWNTPSFFIYASLLKKAGLFDEEFIMLEDYPFWLKLTKMGFKLNYFDITTVHYRLHESISYNTINWISKQFFISQRRHFKKYVFPELSILNKKLAKKKSIHNIKMMILIYFFKNERTLFARIFNRIFNLLFLSKND